MSIPFSHLWHTNHNSTDYERTKARNSVIEYNTYTSNKNGLLWHNHGSNNLFVVAMMPQIEVKTLQPKHLTKVYFFGIWSGCTIHYNINMISPILIKHSNEIFHIQVRIFIWCLYCLKVSTFGSCIWKHKLL